MKKKLFAGATVLLSYTVFVIGLSIADSGGYITAAVSKIGLANAGSALAAPDLDEGTLIDPMPKPDGPKPPPPPDPQQGLGLVNAGSAFVAPDLDEGTLIDPMPKPDGPKPPPPPQQS